MTYGQMDAVDHGQYERVMADCGLTWTEEDLAAGDLQYVRAISRFAYARFPWVQLLSPLAGSSTVYAVAPVRLLTEPFGLPFTTDAMAAVWAVILAAACGLITEALFRLGVRAWFLPCLVLCALYGDGNFCAVFRGLYPQGAEIAFFLLLTGLCLRAFSLTPDRRGWSLLPVALCSVLFLKSGTGVIVFLPVILAVNGILAWSCRKTLSHGWLLPAVCALALLCGGRSAVILAGEDPDYYSNAAAYESFFNGMLTVADDPESILTEYGLDASYAGDIGRSYYEPEENYAHCPRGEEGALLFSRLKPNRVLAGYLRHPELLGRLMLRTDGELKTGFENVRNRTLDANGKNFHATRADGGFPALIWRLLFPGETGFALAALALLILETGLWIRRRRIQYGLTALLLVSFLLYLPFTAAYNGLALSAQYILFQVLLSAALGTGILCGLMQALPRFREWLIRFTREADPMPVKKSIPLPSPQEPAAGFLLQKLRKAADSRALALLVTGVTAVFMLVMVFAPADHPASVNNGDFGRMMIQMDLTWEGMQYYDTATQAGRYAIEEFVFTKPFRPLKLTPLEPTYSLYWFVSLTRLLTEPFGRSFSTWTLAWVMGAVSVLCLLKIIWDLQPLLRRWTIPAALVGCAMLFSETYLTWYNSLFGEGSILTGLLLSIMCALHLVMMPRKAGWKRQAWLVGLVISLNILITAKSQMLLAMPGAVGLVLWLSWYHRSWRYDLRILQGSLMVFLCVCLGFSALAVYQTDRTEDSVSQKHTLWQAYFYGIFMISDDPLGDMEALGVDTAMAPDIGKFVQFDNDSLYVYAPLSEEAQKAFYDHVSMGTIIQWYLTHPGKLWYMLNYAAGEGRKLYTDFRVYCGQDYADPAHDPVNGFHLWPAWREFLSPGTFLGYVLFYGALLFLLFRGLFHRRKEVPAEVRIRFAVPLFLIITGILQYPLSVLGNGFADNQKQLFCFALCHDFLLAGFLILGLRRLSAEKKTV